MSCLVLLLCLPAAAAYTLLGAHSGRSLRTVGCFAAEKGPSGGNALEGPQGGGPAISARALDQLIQADPEKKKAWKGFKRGKKQSERKTEQKSAPSGKGFGGAQTARFDRRPAKGVACACGSAQSYEACCQPCHEAGLATEPLALIRARYTAYAYRLPDFLIDTTSPDHEEWETDRTAWKKDLLTFCDTFVCEGLEVGQQQAGDAAAVGGADAVQVPFRAKLVQKGAIKMLDLLETSTPARSYKIGAMAAAKLPTYVARGAYALGPLGSGAELRLGLAVPPWSLSGAPPKHATVNAFGHPGTLVRGAAGGWLYAKGDVEYEATPEAEYEAKGEA